MWWQESNDATHTNWRHAIRPDWAPLAHSNPFQLVQPQILLQAAYRGTSRKEHCVRTWESISRFKCDPRIEDTNPAVLMVSLTHPSPSKEHSSAYCDTFASLGRYQSRRLWWASERNNWIRTKDEDMDLPWPWCCTSLIRRPTICSMGQRESRFWCTIRSVYSLGLNGLGLQHWISYIFPHGLARRVGDLNWRAFREIH